MMAADVQPDRDPPRLRTFLPLRTPIFRAVWIASMASHFGAVVQSVGAAWMMTSIAGSAEMVALVQASVTLPFMFFSLVAGAVADSFDRRRVLLAAQLFMLSVSILLTIGAWMQMLTPWLLLSFTFLIGCGMAFNGPAWQASVGDMVPRSDLPGAVALNSMSFNIARSVGPAIGGAIVAAAGAVGAFAVNAFSYLGLIGVLARWRPEYAPRTLPRETLGVAITAGIRYASMSPAIRAVLMRSTLFGIGVSAIPAMMPLIARHVIAGGPVTYGLLLGSFGIGSVGGLLASARLRSALSSEGIVASTCFLLGIAAPLAGYSPYLPATMAVLLIAGASWVLVLSTFNVSIQLHSPRWVVARALSIYQMVTFGGMAAGSWLWGIIAERHGIETSLLVAGALQITCSLMGLRLSLPKASALNLDPAGAWEAPNTDVSIEPRSGPVVITIEYRIAPEDRDAFLAAMAERRRVRRRNGARHWHLLRDLADASIWVERFQIPTWLEYVRHNNRITQADLLVTDRIRAFHQGPEPPIVRRMIERQTGSIPAGRDPGAQELSQPLTDTNI